MPDVKFELKTVKEMLKKFYMLLFVCAALACKAAPMHQGKVEGSTDLQPDEKQSLVAKVVAEMITTSNYKKVPLDDSLSVVIFNKFLKSLDEGHNYLLDSDLVSFAGIKTNLDDDIKKGDLSDVFYMFNVYQKRYNERIKYSLAQLDDNFDFTKPETFTFDREDQPYLKSTAEMNELWTKRVKYDLLNLKLANPDLTKDKETLKKRYENMLKNSVQLNNRDVFQLFMDAFTYSIDPHSYYLNPFNASEFNMEMSKSLEGIGATLALENDYVTIKTIVPGGPAFKSKQLNIDDRILGVAQGKTGEFQDVVGWRLDNAIALIRGPKGTVVRLKILPKGKNATDKPNIIEIVREKIILQDQSAKEEIRTYNQNGRTYKIGFINIPSFYMDFAAYRSGDPNYKSTTRDVRLILDTLKQKNVDGVVIDLRDNGGGSLPEAISLTGLFIKTGPVVQVRESNEHVDVEEDEDPTVSYDGPLAIMTNRLSASASEIFAGAIQDYGRGLIIGSQTYGKGTVQTEIDLDREINPSILSRFMAAVTKKGDAASPVASSQSTFGQLNLTVAKFYRVSGSSTQHKGVMPDITFPSLVPLDKYGEDTEPAALPWDTIAKSNYTVAGNLKPFVPQLTKQYKQRMQNSPAEKYLMKVIADYKKHDTERTVVLDEDDVKKQRDQDDEELLATENLARAAMGLPALKKGETKPKTEDLDFMKKEGGQILVDYIMLKK